MKWRTYVVAAFLVAGCDSAKISDQVLEFNDRSWKVLEPAEFEFKINDIGSPYDVSFTVRNSLDYPFARLFVNYTLVDSVGQELSKKLIANYLFDQKSGEPNGRSGLGDLYDHRFPLLKNYSFRYPGRFKIKMEQAMRQDTLQGVLAVGLHVEKTKSQQE